MKQLTMLMAVLALTFIAFFPTATRADEGLDGLDVTMIVLDNASDLDDTVSQMRGPDDQHVDDDDWNDQEGDRPDDDESDHESERDSGDESADEFDHDSDDEFEHDEIDEEDEMEHEDDFEDGDDVDEDEFDDDHAAEDDDDGVFGYDGVG